MNKSTMRAEARRRLAELDEAERQAASQAIERQLWTIPEVSGARVILLYASKGSEVETDAIAAAAAERGIVLTYPRCLPETRALVLHRVGDPAELQERGSFGIREPDTACPLVSVEEIDVAMVPGLAWDRLGMRLGRGAGYYDRLFLSPGWRGFRCGLFYSVQEFDRLIANRLDAPLDAVVTEKEVVRFERG
jgi:5-formyltetrahydrofolate cyclo-ligase